MYCEHSSVTVAFNYHQSVLSIVISVVHYNKTLICFVFQDYYTLLAWQPLTGLPFQKVTRYTPTYMWDIMVCLWNVQRSWTFLTVQDRTQKVSKCGNIYRVVAKYFISEIIFRWKMMWFKSLAIHRLLLNYVCLCMLSYFILYSCKLLVNYMYVFKVQITGILFVCVTRIELFHV